MKKLISLLLVLLTMLSASITVFAETYNNVGEYEADVTGVYVAGNEGSGTVFCVDIEWQDMEFTYNAAKEPVWNTETHSYSESVAAYWTGTGTINITNHSNTAILATPNFVADTGFENVSMTFSPANLRLATSEFMDFGDAQTGTITITPAGTLPANTAGKIGSVKVTLRETIDGRTVEELQGLLAKVDELLTEMENSGVDEYPTENDIRQNYDTMYAAQQALRNDINKFTEDPSETNQLSMNLNYDIYRRYYHEILLEWNAIK